MSYVNGVGNPQQTIGSITTSEAAPAKQANASSGEISGLAESNSNAQHADQTTLSTTSGLVAHALEGSDARSEKVTSLQQTIAAGTYSVSSSAVADKIIQSLLE
jgi:flagellar biosynthesis anti-sigma factor FlgM